MKQSRWFAAIVIVLLVVVLIIAALSLTIADVRSTVNAETTHNMQTLRATYGAK